MSSPDSCCLSGRVGCWGARWGGAGGCPGWCRAGSRSGWWGSGSCWRNWWCEPELKQRNIFNIQHLNKKETFETLVFNHMAEYCAPIGLCQSSVQWEHSILSHDRDVDYQMLFLFRCWIATVELVMCDYDKLLPSWTGLAETTLLLVPSPIIVWATVQNSYSSPNLRPAKCQNNIQPNILWSKVR